MDNRYEIAEQNGMSREFADWFFENKKAGCGNVWFMMMAAMWEGWQGRAAMLQSFGNSEQLNSPVIQDGWVPVPVEPTAEMLQSGISAHYERSQIQIHDRPAPGPMECAYVAMIAAAPQHEVTQALAKGMERYGDAMQELAQREVKP